MANGIKSVAPAAPNAGRSEAWALPRALLPVGLVPGAFVLTALFGWITWETAFIGIGAALAATFLMRRFRQEEQVSALGTVASANAAFDLPCAPLALLDQLPEAVMLVDAEMRLAFANKAAREQFLGGRNERKYLSAALRRPQILEAVQRVWRGAPAESVDFADLVPVERHLRASVCIVPAEAGAAPTTLLVIRDLTAIKRAEQMRADFVANASHELRTPLSSLAGFIETLRGHAKDDMAAREKFLSIMQGQAERMRRLIEDLLSLSRIELNEHVPPSDIVDLRAVVSEVVGALQPLAAQANTEIRIEAREHLRPVTGTRDELVQVLQNLVDNALKYGGTGGKIEIEIGPGAPAPTDGLAVESSYVAVRDRGPGIAREHIPRLTERFYRVDVKESRERGGTGLGLAIVKHIVSRHRGRLHIKSEVGQGSTFTIILPAAPAAPVPNGTPVAAAAPGSAS